MGNRGDLQTPFADAVGPTPSGSGDGIATSGGFDFPGGKSESPNLSSLPLLPTTYTPDEGAPGVNDVIGMPPVDSPRTIPTKGMTGE